MKRNWTHLKVIGSKDKNGNPNPPVVLDVKGNPLTVAAPKKVTRTVRVGE